MTVSRSLFVLVLALLPASTSAQSSMFRGSAEHRGEYPGSGAAAFGGLQWRVQTLGPVRGSPTVSGEAVYVGSSDGHIYAIDLKSGDVRWRRNLESPVISTPAVSGNLVVVGSYDEQGNAAAWIKNFGGPPGTGFIRFFAGDGSPGRPQNFVSVQAVAETRRR